MYRLMIIDDDTAIREHIKEIIPWERMRGRKLWLCSCSTIPISC